jgi:hypothetical protein
MQPKKTISQKIKFAIERAIQIQLTRISPVWNTKWMYWRKMGRRINLENPQTFSEKINWLKLFVYHNDPLVIQCSDKFAVRDYVESCGYPELLNELYGVYNKPQEIEWEKLPDKFAVKWNFGNGLNLFCKSTKTFNTNAATQKLRKWGKTKPHFYLAVMHYKYIHRKIIVEKFIDGLNSDYPDDFKIYCFNGSPAYIMVCSTRDSGRTQFYFLDNQWNFCSLYKDKVHGLGKFSMNKPEGVDLAIFYAEKLCKPFPFVRIDFYIVNGQPVLGEMTFTPSGGFDVNLKHEDADMAFKRESLFGKLLDISMYKN